MDHKFWRTQPVPQEESELESLDPASSGALEEKSVEDIRKEPYQLPSGFTWANLHINDDEELNELYKFLNHNYVEDNDAQFRFDYSPEFLRWGVTPPGYLPEWHLAVRGASNNKLCGFIAAIPATMTVHDKQIEMVEINFLCVHKKLRDKRLAPMLIREITRRCNIRGIFQAAYTAGAKIPTPVTKCRYWHRNLNVKKLLECRFTSLQGRQTMARMIKLYRLPQNPETKGLRKMTEEDVVSAHKLLTNYLKKFKCAPNMNVDDFTHWFLPRDKVIHTYVKTSKGGQVTDLCSFYSLPSSVIDNPLHKTLFVAYSYYNVSTTIPLTHLVNDALILARQTGHDVFNALDLMDNNKFIPELKFGKGDGELHYYLYNWKCPTFEPNHNGLVLL